MRFQLFTIFLALALLALGKPVSHATNNPVDLVYVWLAPGDGKRFMLTVNPDNNYHNVASSLCNEIVKGSVIRQKTFDCSSIKVESVSYATGGQCKFIDGTGAVHTVPTSNAVVNDLGDGMLQKVCCGSKCGDSAK